MGATTWPPHHDCGKFLQEIASMTCRHRANKVLQAKAVAKKDRCLRNCSRAIVTRHNLRLQTKYALKLSVTRENTIKL
jgi:hypothetical protein